jgi:hypothetical protein
LIARAISGTLCSTGPDRSRSIGLCRAFPGTGDVRVTITVQNGNIVNAEASSGPAILASAAARFVRSNWKFSPTTTGTYTLPVSFVLTN